MASSMDSDVVPFSSPDAKSPHTSATDQKHLNTFSSPAGAKSPHTSVKSPNSSAKAQKSFREVLEEYHILLRIYNDVVHSSNMPLLTSYLHDYNFYPPEVDPENLPLADHAVAYLKNIPFLCLYYANIVLRGVGQVYICNHPITGLLVCIGLYLTSPTLMVYGILGTIFENIGAFVVCRPPLDEIESGLFGYDGTLVGCAVYTFLSLSDSVVRHPSLSNDGLLIMATLSFVVGVLHSTCVNLNKLPALTLAFNITTLVFLMALARGTSTVATLTWLVDNPPSSVTVNNYWLNLDGYYFYDALFRGVGQFCFVDTTAGGVLVVAGIFLCSRKAGCMALLGSTTAMFMSRSVLILPRANKHLVRKGLFSYNAVGTCVALGGGIFYKTSVASTLVAIFGAALTVLMQTAVQSVLDTDGLGLPVLTIPFVVTAWTMMMCRSDWLVPIMGPDADLDDAQTSSHKYEDTWLYRPKKKLFHETTARKLYRQRSEGVMATGGGVSNTAANTSGKPSPQKRGRRAWFPLSFPRRNGSERRIKRVYIEEKKE